MNSNDNSFLTWVARIVSLVLHPIWLPLVYGTWQSWGDPDQSLILVILTVCVLFFPGLIALIWMRIKTETDWFVMSQGNRIVPLAGGLMGTLFFAFANGSLLPYRYFNLELTVILLVLLTISLVVTLFWKISIHMLGWGAVCMFCILHATNQNGQWTFAVLGCLTSLVVAWARMRVKSHDWKQILVGWAAGMVSAFIVFIAMLVAYISSEP